MRIAAIDQGTTSTRVLILEGDGRAHVSHSVRHAQKFPQSGWVEHDPEELLRNVADCIVAAGNVDAIGISNQGESCFAWDAETGAPLSPVIVWQDNRTQGSLEDLRADGAEDLTLARAGLPLDAYFSASKLRWILTNSPEAQQALAAGRLRLGTTDAFFMDRLAGRFVTDVTTASRTSLMNLETCEWDVDLCQLFGVPMETLPRIGVSAGTTIGKIGEVPVTACVVDQQAALYGHGCRAAGDAKITFGTGAFALALTGNAIVRGDKSRLLPTVAWKTPEETVYAVDGGIYDAGAAIEWLGRIGVLNDVSELQTFAAPPAIENELVFVPALSGLACPHWDRSAAGLWIGMSGGTTREQMLQSALEGIAMATVDVIEAMESETALGPSVSIDGGLSRSPYFAQFLADMSGRTIIIRSFDELTALGCAALAAKALARAPRIQAMVAKKYAPQERDVTEWKRRYRDALARSRGWRAL